MYTAQITKDRIKNLCKNQKVSMEQMLSELNLGINAVRQITDTKGMSSVSLYKIADYLNVSVDYLLGRTDNENINFSNNNGQDTIKQNFMILFDKLNFENQIEIMQLAKKLNEQQNPAIQEFKKNLLK